jgi:hypothetical protein
VKIFGPGVQGFDGKAYDSTPVSDLEFAFPLALFEVFIGSPGLAYLIVQSGVLQVLTGWILAGNRSEERLDVY